MTQSDIISIIADGIQFQEGKKDTDPSYRNNNPGNLRFVGQNGATKSPDGFCVFKDYYAGRKALEHDIELKLNSGILCIRDLIYKYAPPSDNNPTEAYIQQIVDRFIARNLQVIDVTRFSSMLMMDRQVVLIAVNNIIKAVDFLSTQTSIAQCAVQMKDYVFVTRYGTSDLSHSLQSISFANLGTISIINKEATRSFLQQFNEGQTFNVMLYNGTVHQGGISPAGGCEWQGGAISYQNLNSSFSSVLYNGAFFTDYTFRAMFHELIHELYTLTGNDDVLHEYLTAHGGYKEEILTDLQFMYHKENELYKEKKLGLQIAKHTIDTSQNLPPAMRISIWRKVVEFLGLVFNKK